MISLLAQNSGFLPTRGSFMLDFVVVAMAGILPILFASIFLVRSQRKYELHKWIQTTLGVTLLVAVVAFEVDVRFFSDWQELAAESPYFTAGTWNPVWYALIIHLCFAIPTPLIWIYVIVQGLREGLKQRLGGEAVPPVEREALRLQASVGMPQGEALRCQAQVRRPGTCL